MQYVLVHSPVDCLQPFKDKMDHFISTGMDSHIRHANSAAACGIQYCHIRQCSMWYTVLPYTAVLHVVYSIAIYGSAACGIQYCHIRQCSMWYTVLPYTAVLHVVYSIAIYGVHELTLLQWWIPMGLCIRNFSIMYLCKYGVLYLAQQNLQKADRDLKHCTMQFGRLVDYYCAKPPAGQSCVSMEYFFASWFPFVQDFRQYWERVMAKRCVCASVCDYVLMYYVCILCAMCTYSFFPLLSFRKKSLQMKSTINVPVKPLCKGGLVSFSPLLLILAWLY